jgi:dihydroxy-acid dehydratase
MPAPSPLEAAFRELVPTSDAELIIPPRGITADEGFPAAEAMLAPVLKNQGIEPERLTDTASVVVFGVGYDGNPCNMQVSEQVSRAKAAITRHPGRQLMGVTAINPGVSDGITMGHSDMSFSLPSREHIAAGLEIAASPRQHVGVVAIAGCDKNYPGVVMGAARVGKPFYMINGGTIMPGMDSQDRELDVVSSFEAAGAHRSGSMTQEERDEIIRCSIPGAGACGGMYTANTMTSAIEALGLMIPGTAAIPAVHGQKRLELSLAGNMMHHLIENDLTPNEIVTEESFENALTVAIALGGSTNIVLHSIAMAREFSIDLTYDDVQIVSDRTPVLADMKPAGKYHMNTLYQAGGIPAVMRYLAELDLINTEVMTVTGRTVGENLAVFSDLADGQQVIRTQEEAIKPEGHIQILYGNIAPEGGVAKITGENAAKGSFSGEALVCESEQEAIEVFDKNPESFKGKVIVIRNVGLRGSPGMPEMLAITSRISGAGLDEDCALITDGRFSGGTHGLCVGHIEPEAERGGPIALLQNGDRITIDVENGINRLDADLSDKEFAQRRETWEKVVKPVKGFLATYRALVQPAHQGAITVPRLDGKI